MKQKVVVFEERVCNDGKSIDVVSRGVAEYIGFASSLLEDNPDICEVWGVVVEWPNGKIETVPANRVCFNYQ